MTEFLTNFASDLSGFFLGMTGRIALIYMASFVGVAFVLWLWRKPEKGFIAWLFPRDVYFNRSSLVDLQVFLFGRALSVLGVATRLIVPTAVAVKVMTLLVIATGGVYFPPENEGVWRVVTASVLIFLTLDFCVYLVHRVHHETSVLWPFHSLHHSAESMTPLTVYRIHPLYSLLSQTIKAVLLGTVQAVVLFFVMGQVDILTIGGTNAFYVIFNICTANFRHSHIWISFGPVIERIFISPAQHQIHHSSAPEHHDKNYGEVLAIWDWMFGTLYIPKEREILAFGLAEADGTRIDQPHPTFWAALTVPFVDSAKAFQRLFAKKSSGTKISK